MDSGGCTPLLFATELFECVALWSGEALCGAMNYYDNVPYASALPIHLTHELSSTLACRVAPGARTVPLYRTHWRTPSNSVTLCRREHVTKRHNINVTAGLNSNPSVWRDVVEQYKAV